MYLISVYIIKKKIKAKSKEYKKKKLYYSGNSIEKKVTQSSILYVHTSAFSLTQFNGAESTEKK